jgi:hypothetical protein
VVLGMLWNGFQKYGKGLRSWELVVGDGGVAGTLARHWLLSASGVSLDIHSLTSTQEKMGHFSDEVSTSPETRSYTALADALILERYYRSRYVDILSAYLQNILQKYTGLIKLCYILVACVNLKFHL